MRRLHFCGLILLFSILSLSSCGLFEKEPLIAAKDLSSQGRKKDAVQFLLKKMESSPTGAESLAIAQYGAQLAHLELRDYQSAVVFYQYIANYSTDPKDQLMTLKYLGSIYFDHLRDFEMAIQVYENLLRAATNNEEKSKYRLLLAKSHYNLAQIDQAESELSAYMDLKLSESERYEGKVFETNLLVSKKQHAEATKILKELIEKFPERAKSDGLEMNLVACYEDMEDFDEAIDAMTKMRGTYPDPEFLDMRINRLKERKNNMPGARGLRK
ncbi:MAG TPA: hypothetical protein DCL41_06075 [Bdellovibrionales bacterium]|nr:hypothetical protein [Bdellovibrionales bacterium]